MTIILKYLIKEASLLQKIVSNNQKQLSKIMKGLVSLEREIPDKIKVMIVLLKSPQTVNSALQKKSNTSRGSERRTKRK
jgi:hypothetical protein